MRSLTKEEDGAQVVEYALIIAVISIALVIALGDTATGVANSFSTIINRVTDCFTPAVTCI